MRFRKEIGLAPNQLASYSILITGLVTGISFFLYFYLHHLTVAHYDAKAHLLVARRIVDSLEPGYAQIGVDWLPVIHLVYLPFVIFESQYRSGILPSLVSVCSFAISGWLTYRISIRLTGSNAAGIFAAVVLLANSNLEYLQSCPLTEPLYMMLFLLAVDSLISWRESDHSTLPWLPAIWCILGALCRYEGWVFFAGVLLLLVCDYWTQYIPRRKAIQAGMVYLAVFTIPAAAHFGYIYLQLRDNFFRRVVEGNPAPYVTYKRPFLSLFYHLGELSQMAAILPVFLAAAGLMIFLIRGREWKLRAPMMLLWLPSLINILALYWGMIYRVRYAVLLLPAVAIFGSLVIASVKAKPRALIFLSIAAMALPWLSWFGCQFWQSEILVPGPGMLLLPAVALVLFLIARAKQFYNWVLPALLILGMQVPPLARENRPILGETLEHEFMEPERQQVIQYLRRNYDGNRIMIDMGKQAPLVYDSGFSPREFVYNEGGGRLWQEALRAPALTVGWLCIQKGDAMSEHLRVDPNWTVGYSLAVKTEYFSIYRREN